MKGRLPAPGSDTILGAPPDAHTCAKRVTGDLQGGGGGWGSALEDEEKVSTVSGKRINRLHLSGSIFTLTGASKYLKHMYRSTRCILVHTGMWGINGWR